ncbi:MAG TPA: TnsD family Tn7-like transposition protein, partial [Longimicrobium sp.]
MPAIFPTLYPEEPLLSAMARYAEAMAYPEPHHALHALFGRGGASPRVSLPQGLDDLIQHLPTAHPYTFMGLALGHTAYPYHRSFLSDADAVALRNSLSRVQPPRRGRGWRYQVAKPWPEPYLYPITALRFCDACVAEDRASLDREPYWRRVHQLVGVLVCPVHALPLRVSSSAARWPDPQYLEHQWSHLGSDPPVHSLVRALDEPHTPVEAPAEHSDMLLAVARESLWLLQNPVETAHVADLDLRYRAHLTRLGFIDGRRRIHLVDLHRAFLERIPPDLIDALECCRIDDYVRFPRGGWLAHFFKKRHTYHSPIFHILLQQFLGVSAEQFFAEPVPDRVPLPRRARAVGPCRNPVCSEYPGQESADAHSASPPASAGYLDVDCPVCGFAYSRRVGGARTRITVRRVSDAWLRRLRELAGTPELSLADAAATLGVGIAKLRNEACMLRVWNPAWGPAPDKGALPRREHTRRQHRRVVRRRWRTLIRMHETADLRELRSLDPRAYRYLRHHDHEWLQKELPRAPPRPRYRVAWGYLDYVGRSTVPSLVRLLREWAGAPVRITIGEVARHLNPSTFRSPAWIRRMPDTLAVLAPMVESVHSFAERRIVWAAKWLMREGVVPSPDEIAVRAGLSKRQRRALTPALDAASVAVRAAADGADLPDAWAVDLREMGGTVPGDQIRRFWSPMVYNPRDFRYFFGSPDTPFPGGYHAEKKRRPHR